MDPWRLVFTDIENQYIYSDWPVQIDLSYDDANLLSGATGGFPVGDLNWFPAQKATWEAQKEAEHAAITAALEAGNMTVGIEDGLTMNHPVDFRLDQNYPNPFNPNTTINFTIAKAGNVTLKVYNALGQEVATLVNGFKQANTYNVTFNGSDLASGVYIYTLNYNNNVVTKKMILLK